MYPNLNDTTRLIMITELESDLKNGLFYVPKSIKPDFVCAYKRILIVLKLTQALRMHLKRIGLKPEVLELVKLSLKMTAGNEQEYHKSEVERINGEIDNCKEVLKKMYLDQVNNILEYDLWVSC